MKFTPPHIVENQKFSDYSQISITVIAVIIFTIFAIRPSIVRAYRLYVTLSEYKALDEQLKTKVNNLKLAEELEDEHPEINSLINKALPDTPDEGEVIKNINFIASKNSVNVTSVNFSALNAEGSAANTLDIGISAEGTYDDMVLFVSDLSRMLRLFNIDTLEIKTSNNLVVANISGKAFYD